MSRSHLILAVAPVSRGFGYIVLDQAGAPIDWRVKELRDRKNRNARCATEVDKLLERHRPSLLVIEDYDAPGSKRQRRICELLDLLAELAIEHGADVARYGPRDIRVTFGLPLRANKDDVAGAVAKHLPVLKPRMPKRKRIWETERYAMAIFSAAALALTHLSRAQRRER